METNIPNTPQTVTQTSTKTSVGTKIGIALLGVAGLAAAAAAGGVTMQTKPTLVIEQVVTTRQEAAGEAMDGYALKKTTAVMGEQNVPLLTLRLAAKNADIELNSLKLQLLSGTGGALTPVTDPMMRQVIDGCTLEDPKQPLGPTEQEQANLRLDDDGMLIIGDPNSIDSHEIVRIDKNTTLEMTVACSMIRLWDEEDAALFPANMQFALAIAADGVQATSAANFTDEGTQPSTQLNPNQIRVGGQGDPGINLNGDKASVTVIPRGTLTISPVNNPPDVKSMEYLTIGNGVDDGSWSSNPTKATLAFKLSAEHEPFSVEFLTLENCVTPTSSTAPCATVGVPVHGKLVHAAPGGHEYAVDFEFGPPQGVEHWSPMNAAYDSRFDGLIINPGSPVTVRFEASAPRFFEGASKDGGFFRINLDALKNQTFHAKGTYSSSDIEADDVHAYITGDDVPVYLVPPLVTALPSLPDPLPQGSANRTAVYFPTITPPGNNRYYLTSVLFKIDATDPANTNWASCKNLGVANKWSFAHDDYQPAGTWQFLAGDGTPCAVGKNLGFVRVTYPSSGFPINPQDSQTLFVDISQATTGDTLTISIPQKPDAILWTVNDRPESPILNADRIKNLPARGQTVTK